jgi:putative hydrolase of the HAD superfamily
MSTPHNIEGLLFDMGGVVIGIDFDQAFRCWTGQSQLPIEEMRRRFTEDDAYKQHERGEIDAAEYFAHLRAVLELEATDEDIALGWNAIYAGEITETLNDILLVRDRLPCFALTNSNPTHQVTWMAIYPRVVAAFHRIFVSTELGLRKPERAAFHAVAEATGIRPTRMLFFDDAQENVEGARAAGLQAVQVRAPSDVKRALVDIGVL